MWPRWEVWLCLAVVLFGSAPASVRADDADYSAALCERAIANGARQAAGCRVRCCMRWR